MVELEERCLEAFPRWLQQLGDDVRSLLSVIGRDDVPEQTRLGVAATVNYLLKSIDLIPDGIEDLGFLDDAFVLRVGARRLLTAGEGEGESDGEAEGDGAGKDAGETLTRLAADAELIEELLGPTYGLLDRYVDGLGALVVRGRDAAGITGDAALQDEFASEVRSWADSYVAPAFARDAKNLIKLKSFLATKLAPK